MKQQFFSNLSQQLLPWLLLAIIISLCVFCFAYMPAIYENLQAGIHEGLIDTNAILIRH